MTPQPRWPHPLRRCLLLCAFAVSMPAWAAPAKFPVFDEARTAFWWGDFAALEKQNNDLKQHVRFTADGMSELEFFRLGLQAVIDSEAGTPEPYLQELEALTLQWATEHPKSALAHILHARVLMAHAWSYRGSGYAKNIPPQALKDFQDYLLRAFKYLEAHADVTQTDSYAHATLIDMGKAMNMNAKQLSAIAQDGLKHNPQDFDLYFNTVEAMLPKWGGDPGTLDKFISLATEQTQAIYGTGMYARLYYSAARNDYGHALFDNSYVDWAKLRRAYEDLLARYPDSAVQRNRFAYMACLAKDKVKLLDLLEELGSKVDAEQWGANPERSLEGCRRFAREG